MLVVNICSFCSNLKNILLIIFAFVFPISLAGANVILILLILCWIFEGKWKEKLDILKTNKLVWILYALPVLLIISTLFSNSSVNGFLISSGYKNEYQFVFKHFIWLNTLFIVLITSKFDVKKIITAFLLGMFFSEIVSYSIFFHFLNFCELKRLGLIYRNADDINPSPFMHHTFYSLFLSVAILLIFDNLHNFKSKAVKIIGVLFLISATINLFINNGRTGQLAFFLGVFIYSVLKYKKIKLIVGVFLLLSAIFIGAYYLSPIFKQRINQGINNIEKVFKRHNYDTSWGIRIGIDKIGMKILKEPKNFIFGLGAGDAKKKFFEYAKKQDKNIYKTIKIVKHLHNQYLQLWMDGSILAFLLIILYFIYLYKYSPIPLTAGFIAIYAFSFIADVMLYRPKTYILFLFISAVLIKLYSSTYRETSSIHRGG
jgi:O-antigen ligase